MNWKQVGYCMYSPWFDFIGEKYKELREWVVREFGWDVWFDTKQRNEVLSDGIGVMVQISNECGAIIPYELWMQRRKMMKKVHFQQWVLGYILEEDARRKAAAY